MDNHGKVVPLPNNMTSDFQPLDLTVFRCPSYKHYEYIIICLQYITIFISHNVLGYQKTIVEVLSYTLHGDTPV